MQIIVTSKIEPPWMETADLLRGIKEDTSSKSNQTILKWAELVADGVERDYTTDATPWCGLFVAFCMQDNGLEPVHQPLWAQNWNKYGDKLKEPCYGAIMVFVRNGGGHVGFYVSEDTSYYHILGGNQSDQVNVTRVAKGRCIGYRWPENMEKFRVPGRIKREWKDGKVSTNEA